MCLFELWFSQSICPIVGLLGHMVVLSIVVFFFFKGISIPFSIVTVSIYILTHRARIVYRFFMMAVLTTVR